MAISMDDLRVDWIKQIDAYDRMIMFLEEEKKKGSDNPAMGKPTREWMGMLEVWRDELKNLLAIYPGTC